MPAENANAFVRGSRYNGAACSAHASFALDLLQKSQCHSVLRFEFFFFVSIVLLCDA